jgi:hypothetical protein
MRTPTAHTIALADRTRIKCDKCDAPALMCERSPHVGGVSFWHYCGACWHAPAANGGPSASVRTGVGCPVNLDYEARWLAECRAHGETRRKLEAAVALIQGERQRHGETLAKLEAAVAPPEDDGESDDAWTGGFSENH